MIPKSIISRKKLYDLRIKALSSTDEVLDLNNQDWDVLSLNLSSLTIAITPYEEVVNTMTFDNSENEVETKVLVTSEDIDTIINPEYGSSDFLYKKTFESIEETINHVRDLISFKNFDNKVDFTLFIDKESDDLITIDSKFTTLLFKTFRGNLTFYGNENSSFHISSMELEISSLNIEYFNIIIDKIVLFHTDYFNIKHCKINGLGAQFAEPDQFVFYAKETSNFLNNSIESSIRIGFSGIVTSQYKWQNTSLNISYIDINFNTNAEKDKKYDHIFKITDFYVVKCDNISIKQKMTKLVPFKFDRCNSLDFYNYDNLLRPKDKGTNEISINDSYKVNIINMKVVCEDINTKATSAISISNFEEYGEVFLYDIDITNLDLISVGNSELESLQLSKINISTSQSVFDLEDSNNFIDELIISDSNIETNNLNILNQHMINISNCQFESSDDIKMTSFKTIIKDSTLISKKNINLSTYGYELDEETASISLNNSLINSMSNINFESERENSTLTFTLTRIKCNKEYNDKQFNNVSLNEAKFECKTINLLSKAYNSTETIIQNDLFSTDKPVLITGLFSGLIEINYETNTKSGIYFKRDLPEENMSPDIDSVEIRYNNNFQDIKLINDIYIENYCLNILNTCIESTTNALVNYHIIDNTPENFHFNSGLYLYKDSNCTGIEHYIKNLTVDKNSLVFINDGTQPSDTEKLNYGVKP